ncbi:hypothetical protein TRFO_30642 [Tritrichomonas foetus]|uniref:Uncharacterized protein n=1 Tax=Tritrichomonas foetus TaxID=1144522 RepID=A0A1J4JT79_9EUKA|nr:hypothetical protein TRFO_30642 [Tritrichomonas foetus]|eukprot:OHT02275.1 hypothetical protein TRFO_30642 [Tritrichomonas foetus]
MGTNGSSVPPDYREQHWSREIDKLFTSTKISDQLDFSPDFLIPLIFENDLNKPPIYAFISRDGEFLALSHILPEIPCQAQLHNTEIISVCEFSKNSFLVVTNKNIVYLVSYENDKFCFRDFQIQNPRLAAKIDESSFLVATTNSSVYLIRFSPNNNCNHNSTIDNNISENNNSCETNSNDINNENLSNDCGSNIVNNNSIENNQDEIVLLFDSEYPSLPVCLIFQYNIIALSTESGLLIGKLETDSKHAFYQIYSNVNHLVFLNLFPQSPFLYLYCVSADTKKILGLKINSDLAIADPKDVFTSHVSITDLQNITNTNTLIFCGGKDIHSYTPDFIRPQLHVSIQNDKNIISLLQMHEPKIFVAICIDGTIVVCRHPEFTRADPKKGEIEVVTLFNYHKSKPFLKCAADDFSFLTFDENHVPILWESFPDWWSAPYYLRMFDDNNNELPQQ